MSHSKGHNGNGNGGSIFHFWQSMHDEEGGDVPETMEEYHLDCRGTKRKFRLTNYGRGRASFLEAQELREGKPGGLRLVASYNEETQEPPYYELRQQLAERLATRDLVRDPGTGRLDGGAEQDVVLRVVVEVGAPEKGRGGAASAPSPEGASVGGVHSDSR